MPIEIGVWRIDSGLQQISSAPLDFENRLEEILNEDISIVSPNWMIIGRQVRTPFGHVIDLLAIDGSGNLIIIELKRDKTHRDIVSQVLDYGSWVKDISDDDIAKIYQSYLKKYQKGKKNISLDEAFEEKFGQGQMPDELNESHELVIVASSLDLSTERIVNYLGKEHGVRINAVFFRVFKDEDREYLSRAWLKEPALADVNQSDESGKKVAWNGEYYVSYGVRDCRTWKEAVKYGFISAGGGQWYTNTLNILEPGSRLWVNIPGKGYVGVGEVIDTVVNVDDFVVEENGNKVLLVDLPVNAKNMPRATDDPEKAEKLVRIRWIKTVTEVEAVKEKGFFGNQNSVAKPRSPKWVHTVERLKKRFGIE